MNREGKNSITKFFSDGSPSNTSEGGLTREQELLKKSKAIQKAKEEKASQLESQKPGEEDAKQAEEKPESTPVKWNPNSLWSGPARALQAIPPVRRGIEKFVARGNNYSNMDKDSNTETFNLPLAKNPLDQLQRDKLIAAGYLKEVTIVALTEAKLRKANKEYRSAKAIITEFLSKQRDAKVNLKSNRTFSLKALSNPQDERMYSSLDLLYFYCDK